MKENEGYELIPSTDVDNPNGWDVRILVGDFVETVIRFGNVAINEVDDNMTFNYIIISSPDPELEVNNSNLISISSEILIDIMERSLNDGSAIMTDKENNGNRDTDSKESNQ